MKNPFSNETVKSAAIVIGSAVAFIALSKGVSILRKKFGGKGDNGLGDAELIMMGLNPSLR